ncbi:MAG TPA: WYL domain-containing protein [Micromonosporaceae bacterium]
MPTELSPTARALRALEILQTRPGTTADQLAERLGVTERAARRYVGILREAGIPVESARGPHGGYRLGRGVRLPPVVFTEVEALSLVMAVLDGQPATADVDDPVGSALGKVIQALPEGVGRQAAALREHASTASDRYWTRPDPATTSALVAAVAARRRVVLTYCTEAGEEWQAEADPWAVVVRYGRWYLLCHSHRAGAVRTYRLDRVRTVEQTPYGFEMPRDLDPVVVLEENLGTGWDYPTRVVFGAPLPEVARWVRPSMGRLEPLGEGCVLVGSTSNPARYAQEWLAGLPLEYRVEGGPELLDAIGTLAARLTAAIPRQRRGGRPDGGQENVSGELSIRQGSARREGVGTQPSEGSTSWPST